MLIPEAMRRRMCTTASGGVRAECDGHSVPAIFRDSHASGRTDTGFELADTSPRLTIVTEDAELLGLVQGKVVRVVRSCGESISFRVRSPERGGTGFSKVILDNLQ